jgi:hypothetical protein
MKTTDIQFEAALYMYQWTDVAQLNVLDFSNYQNIQRHFFVIKRLILIYDDLVAEKTNVKIKIKY